MITIFEDDLFHFMGCTFRYCYGRHSYIVGVYGDMVKRYFASLEEISRRQIYDELCENLDKEKPELMSGWEKIDYNEWLDIKAEMENHL